MKKLNKRSKSFNKIHFLKYNISAKLLADHGENTLKKKYNVKVSAKSNVLKSKNFQDATASFKCNQSFDDIFDCQSKINYEFKHTGDGKQFKYYILKFKK